MSVTEVKPTEEVRQEILERIRQIEEEELPRLRRAERELREPARRGRPPKNP